MVSVGSQVGSHDPKDASVCIGVCMYRIAMYASLCVHRYVCMYRCMHRYVCMYRCMHLWHVSHLLVYPSTMHCYLFIDICRLLSINCHLLIQ